MRYGCSVGAGWVRSVSVGVGAGIEFGDSRVQGFKGSGVQWFRSLGVQGFQGFGVEVVVG
jgi:hypothetical protein